MRAPSKSALAREACERGERTFMAVCIHHGEQPHYASTRACVACQAERNAPKNADAAERYRSDPEYRARWRERSTAARRKRRGDPEYREAERADERKRRARLFATSEDFRGRKREGVAANNWREATEGGNMTGWYGLEREAIQQKYAKCPEGFDMDHAVPKIGKDAQGKHVACGLHCWANLIPTPRVVNGMKRSQFSPETNRLQRPANRFPGGAFDPTPTEHEQALIQLAEEHGTPAEVSLEVLRESLDAKARGYEQHVEALLSKLSTSAA